MAITVVGKLAYMAVTAALSYAANLLLAPKPPKTPLDDSKTEPSVRGTLLPILIGHFRVMGTMGYVGQRYVRDENVSGGGGKGGGDDPTQTVYYESGWHQICIGPGRSLVKIFQGGKYIWQGDINPTNTKSGSVVDTGSEGRFYIYWGENTQPVCAPLNAAMGVASSWPTIFYVYWDSKRLGTSPVWPALEYEVTVDVKKPAIPDLGNSFYSWSSDAEVGLSAQVGASSASYMDGDQGYYLHSITPPNRIRVSNATDLSWLLPGMCIVSAPLGISSEVISVSKDASYYYITMFSSLVLNMVVGLPDDQTEASGYYAISEDFDIYGWPYWGANPSSSMAQFLHQPRPWGAGLPSSLFDNSLQTIHDLLETEETPCTSLLKSGRSWKDGIASILQDMGVVMYLDPVTGLFGFKAIREEAVTTTLLTSEFDGESLVESFGYSVLASESRIFAFKDSARKFSDSTILLTDDAFAKYSDDPNAKKVSLETLTSFPSASRAASRRDQELSVDGALSTKISAGVRLRVGDLVNLTGLSKNYRVASISSNPDEAQRSAGFIEDAYSSEALYVPLGPVGMNPDARLEVSADVAIQIVETNRFTTPDRHGYFVLRIRQNGVTSRGLIYGSSDGTSYADLQGEVQSCTGGVLTSDLDAATGGIVDVGPTIDHLGPDADIYKYLDLSAQDSDWRAGVQMCLIGTELFFLQSVSALVGGSYRLNGLIRARYGTAQTDHAIGATAFVFTSSSTSLFASPWLKAGGGLYVKVVPTSPTSTMAIDDVVAQQQTYAGGGFRPLACENLNTVDDTNAWVATTDIDLRWDYKNALSESSAGVGLSDEPAEVAGPEGYFKLTILNGTTIVREETLLLPAYTYTYADRVPGDFGSEPSTFNIQVVEVLNGLTSPVEATTITRV